jgi:putative transposase
MRNLLASLYDCLRAALKARRDLALENLALRQQLAILKRSQTRFKIKQSDRLLWIWLSRTWSGWRSALIIVKPATVVGWHRRGFKFYWTKLSRCGVGGRPRVSLEVRTLIRQMATANPLWGAPRIHGELLKLGINVSERSVSRLMPRRRQPPSQTWRTFIANHLDEIASVDLFTVPTVTFRVLFCLVVLRHDRRRVLHFNVTEHPTSHWAAQQLVEAFPDEVSVRYLLRDRDRVFGDYFQQRVRGLGLKEVLSAPRSPWQNGYVERLIGSIRRECLDHVIVVNEQHLRRILHRYFEYYHRTRTHLSVDKDTPDTRPVQMPAMGTVIQIAEVGGLHHRYERRAA